MQPTRRSVLSAGALGLVAACTSSTRTTLPPIDPDLALLDAARAREQGLLAAYADLLAAFPHQGTELTMLGAQHLEHLTALGGTKVTATPLLHTQTPTPAPPHQPDSSAAAGAARARLAALERAAAHEHGAAALTASRRLAPLLASLAASEASHAAVLSGA